MICINMLGKIAKKVCIDYREVSDSSELKQPLKK